MDPLSGLAVAQFVDFGLQVLSKGHEVSKSIYGATDSNVQVEAIASDIENLSDRIAESFSLEPISRLVSVNDAALAKICRDCQETATILLARLKRLKAQQDWEKGALFEGISIRMVDQRD